MDEKILAFAGKFGLPWTLVAVGMWKLWDFFSTIAAQQAAMIELLRQLVQLHQR